MKTKLILTSQILALALFAAAPFALAQTSGVPGSMSYQGRISDASGNLVGSPVPVNRTVIFRVWDSPSATANLLYSEQQIVTIASGEFNVLVGQGAQVGSETKPDFDTVFDGAERFLGVTVDDGILGADPEITPRQQLVTSAFAFRARTAEGVPDNAITSSMLAAGAVTPNSIAANAIDSTKLAAGAAIANIAANSINSTKLAAGAALANIAANSIDSSKLAAGAVTTASIAANAIDGSKLAAGAVTSASIAASAIDSTKLAAGAVTSGTIANNAIDSSKIADGTVTGADLANGSVSTAKLDASVTNSFWGLNGVNAFRYNRIGIGTDNPQVSLDVVGGAFISMFDNNYSGGTFSVSGTQFTENGANLGNRGIEILSMDGGTSLPANGSFLRATIGIRSDVWIAAGRGFTVYSDRRIKRDIHASETAGDLAAIEKLQVTDYRMVDPADGGMAWRKGFIAQEVEKVIPGAVTRSREFIPDIFSLATATVHDPAAKSLLLTLSKDHDLKVGERVRLHVDGKRLDLDVSAVPSAREFLVGDCESAPEKVLVYGRQVDDFRTVDYDRIFTTSVGALQELKKEKDAEVKSLRDENTALRDRLAALEADRQTRDGKLEALEKLVLSIKPPEIRTVSLKAGE